MIEAIKNLGLLYLNSALSGEKILTVDEFEEFKKANPRTSAEVIAEDVAENITSEQIKLYVITDDNGGGVWEEEYDKSNYRKYLYKKVDSKTSYFAPTFKSTGSIKKGKIKPDDFFEEWDVHAKIKDLYFSQREEIVRRWKTDSKNIKSTLFTFKVDGKYPGEIKEVSSEFLNRFRYKFMYPKKGMLSKGDGACSLCKREKEVYGAAKPFKFYTSEKEGFFSNVTRKNAWLAFPVCEECAYLMEFGKIYMKNMLKMEIAGYRCYLIPNFLLFKKNVNDILNKKVMKQLEEIAEKNVFGKEKTEMKSIEERLLKKILSIEDFISHDFLFYKESNAAFNISKHIEDVVPSQIQKIVKSIDEVNVRYEDSKWYSAANEKLRFPQIDITFGFLQYVLGNPSSKKGFKSEYIKILDLLDRIFTDKQISYDQLMSDLSAHIQYNFKDSLKTNQKFAMEDLSMLFLQELKLIEFLTKLEVLNMNSENTTPSTEMEKIDDVKKVNEFFGDYRDFFDKPEKKICYLTGVLFGRLCYIQQGRYNGNMPALKYLRSMNISFNDLKNIYQKTILLFSEYKVYGKNEQEVAQLIDLEWPMIGSSWDISKDDVKFFFTMGWTIYDKFLPSKKDKGGNQNE